MSTNTRTYTAEDFASARFAESSRGKSFGIRRNPDDRRPWVTANGMAFRDVDLADGGWVPVRRGLTVDNISDDELGAMVDRAYAEAQEWTSLPGFPLRGFTRGTAVALVIAALTPPPSRPEGAEELERVLTDRDLDDVRTLADDLARAGVRVIGGDQ